MGWMTGSVARSRRRGHGFVPTYCPLMRRHQRVFFRQRDQRVSRSELEVGGGYGVLVYTTQQDCAAGGAAAEDGDQRVASTAEGNRAGECRSLDAETADINQVLRGPRRGAEVCDVIGAEASKELVDIVASAPGHLIVAAGANQ